MKIKKVSRRFFKINLLAFGVMLSSIVFGQDNQSVKAVNAMGENSFTKYVIAYDKDAGQYNITGCCADIWTLSFKDYHGDHKEIAVKKFANSQFPDDLYFPDEEAFPATYVKGNWIGGPDEIEKFDVVEKDSSKRMVILDEWVYFLEDWKSKDDYVIVDVVKKGALEGIKAVKESFSAAKKNEGELRKSELQTYLDAAFAKQAELLPAWEAENKALIAKRKQNVIDVWASINAENDAYWNSPEGQAKRARMSGNADNGPSKFTVENNGSSAREVYCTGSVYTIQPGSSETFSCNNDLHSVIREGGHAKPGDKIIDGGDSCGKTISL